MGPEEEVYGSDKLQKHSSGTLKKHDDLFTLPFTQRKATIEEVPTKRFAKQQLKVEW